MRRLVFASALAVLPAIAGAEPIPKFAIESDYAACLRDGYQSGARTDVTTRYCRCFSDGVADNYSLQEYATVEAELRRAIREGRNPDEVKRRESKMVAIHGRCASSAGLR